MEFKCNTFFSSQSNCAKKASSDDEELELFNYIFVLHEVSILMRSVVVPYCYLFLLSVFILWFSYYVSDIFCKL